MVHLVVKQLLGEHKATIIQKGLDDMLKERRTDDLKLLYNLMGRVKGGLQLLNSSFTSYIKVRFTTFIVPWLHYASRPFIISCIVLLMA